jgi:hypothetical protein
MNIVGFNLRTIFGAEELIPIEPVVVALQPWQVYTLSEARKD